jgi:hypothetical protein
MEKGERRGGHRFEENWSPPVGELIEMALNFDGTCTKSNSAGIR